MQQINLYSEDLRPKTDYLSAEISAAAFIVFLMTLVVVAVFEKSDFNTFQENVVALEESSKTLKTEADALKSKPTVNLKNDIEHEIEQVRRAIHNRQQIEGLLSGRDVGNKKGFSPFFLVLSRVVPKEVSLTGFSFKKAGEHASFEGVSNKVQSIPSFINALQRSDVYKATVFGQLVIYHHAGVHKFHVGPKEALDPIVVVQ